MKKTTIYLAALAMIATACGKEDNIIPAGSTDEKKMITETVKAIDGDCCTTRAVIDSNAKFSWAAGDQVAVHVSDGKYYTTDALVSGGSNKAEFTVTYTDGQSRDAFAVFPASIVESGATNYGQSGKALDITLPGSYTLDQIKDTTVQCPMIATNTAGDSWAFKQICGLLRLTVNNIPKSASYLKIDFDGKKVQGAFSIDSPVTPGSSVIKTCNTDGSDDIITITGLDGSATAYDINLPLPTGNYTFATVLAFDSNDKEIISVMFPIKGGNTYTAARAKGHKVTTILPGLFTINTDGKKVAFAPGNLQYKASETTYKWRFAEHQIDYVGKWDTSNWVDLFGYGRYTGDTPDPLYTYSYYNDYIWDDADFTKESLLVDECQRGYDWRTLSGGPDGEWQYIFNTRSASPLGDQSEARFFKANINDIFCVILLPDSYTHPDGVAVPLGINLSNGRVNTVTDSDWAKMEAAGCVLLPAAGLRILTGVSYAGQKGYYHTSTPHNTDKEYARMLSFQKGETKPEDYGFTYIGTAARLVRVVE